MPHSIEITPQQLVNDAAGLIQLLPAGTEVFVPFLPNADFSATVIACRRLSQLGLKPVPHVAARAFTNEFELGLAFSQVRHAGADGLFLVAGDITRPAGAFASSLDVLESGLIDKHGFKRVGFAAYPQGHPKLSELELGDALANKISHARAMKAKCFLVTQFGFSFDPVARWLRRPEVLDCGLPIRIGIPGPARVRALMAFAMQCGVAASVRALSGRSDAQAAWLGGWRPDSLVDSLVRLQDGQDCQLETGIHWFAFGGLEPTLASMKKSALLSVRATEDAM